MMNACMHTRTQTHMCVYIRAPFNRAPFNPFSRPTKQLSILDLGQNDGAGTRQYP